MAAGQEESVREYYERHTERFLRFGKGMGEHAQIHQPLWAHGVNSLPEAVHYSNFLVSDELSRFQHASAGPILDLGCGVGGSCFYMAERFVSAFVWGVSISPRQIELAQQGSEERALVSRCHFVEASFQSLPIHLPEMRAAYAIEAFAHSPDAAQFFRQLSGVLAEGAPIVVVDDVLSHLGEEARGDDAEWLALYRQGWQVGSLHSLSTLEGMADAAGLKLLRSRNLSPLMRLGRVRDRLIGVLAKFPMARSGQFPYVDSLVGGYAKQTCLRRGLIEYRLTVYRKH